MTRFLQYVVERCLEGRERDIREYNLGLDVFDRDHSFDPRIDSVVRVEARRLRSLLDSYYRHEGAQDPIRIEIPKGSYVPIMRMYGRAHPPDKAGDVPQAGEELPAIAVLPFVDLSPAGNQQYFAEGISEQIIDLMTGVEGVRVLSRTSSFSLRDSNHDAREIGELLGARWIVEGSIRRLRDDLRISVRLVKAADGCQIWAQSFQMGASHVFTMQDQVSRSVATALRRSFLGDARPAASVHRTENVAAYEAYLLARHHFSKQTRQGFREALQGFQKTVSLDSRYAPAYVGLSHCYRTLALFCLMPAEEAASAARSAAWQALVLDPQYGEAHAALGNTLAVFDHDWPAAARQFGHALAIHPVASATRHSYALFCLLPQRRFEEAREQIELASERNPLSPVHGVMESWTAYYSGDFDAAIRSASDVLHYFEHNAVALMSLGRALEQEGMFPDAVAALERARVLAGGNDSMLIGSLGHAYAKAGRTSEARDILAGRGHTCCLRHCDAGVIHAGLGDAAKALDCLEEALAENCPRLVLAGVDPRLAWLRTEPRFLEIARQVGFKLPDR